MAVLVTLICSLWSKTEKETVRSSGTDSGW